MTLSSRDALNECELHLSNLIIAMTAALENIVSSRTPLRQREEAILNPSSTQTPRIRQHIRAALKRGREKLILKEADDKQTPESFGSADSATLLTLDYGNATRTTISVAAASDVERSEIAMRAKKREVTIKNYLKEVNDAFKKLYQAVGMLPDEKNDIGSLSELVKHNLRLRKRVVEMYDECASLYEKIKL